MRYAPSQQIGCDKHWRCPLVSKANDEDLDSFP